jgi:ureidomalonase
VVVRLVELDALGLAGLVAAGEVSCVEVMRDHLDRIAEVNPRLNAIIALRDPDELLAEAAAHDAGPVWGPLHGLPVAVKDLSEVAGLPWTAGSPLYRDRIGAVDEPFVRRMRAAGAIVIGKTNTPELGFGSQTYNPVHGTTVNPYDPTRTAGGSSGGAAAALASRMVPIADGSDYLGSLRNPAAFCQVLGFRPTAGLVRPHGTVSQLGEIGPMGRTVADVAALLAVMADRPGLAELGDAEVAGTRIAWIGDLGGHLATEPGILELGRAAGEALAELGCTVDEVVPEQDFDALWETTLVWRGWHALDHEPLYAAHPELLKPEIRWEVERGLALTALEISRAVAARERWMEVVAALFATYDAVLAPSAQVFPFDATLHWPSEINGRPMDSYHRWMETVAPWSLAGTPVLGMPAGVDARGLPTGVQLIGRPGADLDVLRLGAAYMSSPPLTAITDPVM